MGGQLDENFLAGSLPRKFIILIVTRLFACGQYFLSLSTLTFAHGGGLPP